MVLLGKRERSVAIREKEARHWMQRLGLALPLIVIY
jgi:hypothetical protein